METLITWLETLATWLVVAGCGFMNLGARCFLIFSTLFTSGAFALFCFAIAAIMATMIHFISIVIVLEGQLGVREIFWQIIFIL